MKQNNFISWLFGKLFGRRKCNSSNITYCDPLTKSDVVGATVNINSTTDDLVKEATSIFDSQLVSFTSPYHIKREVGHVIASDRDYLEGDGSVSATYKVTPLHAFDDQTGHGDYYLVDATYVVSNEGMYHPNHANYHGGVRVRIGGFCMMNCDIETTLYNGDKKIDGAKVFAVWPKPETTIESTTYSNTFGWNLGGSVTGGIKSGFNGAGETFEQNYAATIQGGINHTNTETHNVADLAIENKSHDDVVKYNLVNNKTLEFSWWEDYGFSDCSHNAKSSLIFHAAWIWYIPDVKDNDETTKFNIKTVIKPCYKSARFYSTYSDYDDWFDTFTNENVAELQLPNRAPSGTIKIKNNMEGTITNIRIYDVNNKLVNKSNASFASGETITVNVPIKKLQIEFECGKTASNTKKYKYKSRLSDYVELERGTTMDLVADFNFIEISK